MFQISNQPLTRIESFVTDSPLFNKRWILSWHVGGDSQFTTLPYDQDAMPKSIDPSWRKNWKEAILFKPGLLEPFRPIIRIGACRFTTILTIKTRMFTMRIGPSPVEVVLRSVSGQYSQVGFYDLSDTGTDSIEILGQDKIQTLIQTKGHKVTRV